MSCSGHAGAFPIGWNRARGDLMDKSMSSSRWRRRAGLAPCLEPLEGRRLLAAHAAQVTISEGTSQGVPTLLVLGTRNADVINVTDNGTNAAGNVTVTLGNGGTYTTKTAVSEIEILGMGGNDQVSYTLTGPLVAERTVLSDLGSGTDQFLGNVNGAINNPAGLDMEVYAGSGNDTMTINQSGQVMQGTFIPFMSGGRGKDKMTYNGTGSINVGAVINPAIAAGNGNATIVSNYSGTIDGIYAYNMMVQGGNGPNNITDNINVGPGSVGSVGTGITTPALIKAGRGLAHIHYAITVDPTGTGAQIYAELTGVHGHDTVERTANVLDDASPERDSIISS
jgi:hypothetical protein